jgi:cytochrome c oxidase subunit 2
MCGLSFTSGGCSSDFIADSAPHVRKTIEGECMKRKLVLLAMFVGTLAMIVPSGAKAWGAAPPRRIEITAKKFSFDPGEITLKRGQPVVLVVKSMDVAHGIRFRDLNVDLKVGAHNTATVEFTPDKTGDFVGHCSVFCGSGHGSMTLKLHVVD